MAPHKPGTAMVSKEGSGQLGGLEGSSSPEHRSGNDEQPRGPIGGGLKAKVKGSQHNRAGNRLPSCFLAGEQQRALGWYGRTDKSLERIEAKRCGPRPVIIPGQMDEAFGGGSQRMNGWERSWNSLPKKPDLTNTHTHPGRREKGRRR